MSATWTPSHKHLTWAPFQTTLDAQREIEDLKLRGPFWLNDGDSLTRGDVFRVNSSLEVETLAKGGTGKILRADANDLTYSTFTLADTYAAGDLVYASTANTLTGLTVGGAGTILGISGGLPAWVSPTTYLAHNLLSARHSDTTAAAVANGALVLGRNGKWERLVTTAADGGILYSMPSDGAIGAAWLEMSATTGALMMRSAGALPSWAVTLTGNYTFSHASGITITNALTLSAHTATRVLYAGTAGLVTTDAGLTFNDSTNTFTLGTNHIYSQGAHGLALAADDWAVGSSTTSSVQWDNSLTLFIVRGGTFHVSPTTAATPTGVMDIQCGRTSSGAAAGNANDWCYQYGASGGGYRHWLTTWHDAGASSGSRFNFYCNTSATAGGSSAPGTGNALMVSIRGSAASLGELVVTGWANLGTTTLATAQGDLAAGKTGVFQWRYQQSTGTNFWYGSGGAVWAQLIAGTGMSIGTASAPSNSATLDVQGSLGVGAHGTTLSTSDACFGSGTSSKLFYDDSALLTAGYGTGAAVFWQLSSVAGTANVFNKQLADLDFNVKGDTDTNLLWCDASADTVVVGAATVSDSAKFYVSGKISMSGECEINGDLNHDGGSIGFFGTAPATVQTVTGSRADPEGALKSLLSKLATYGLIVDGSSA